VVSIGVHPQVVYFAIIILPQNSTHHPFATSAMPLADSNKNRHLVLPTLPLYLQHE
jgi:hypothetical protein